jgi:hypothetical protein
MYWRKQEKITAILIFFVALCLWGAIIPSAASSTEYPTETITTYFPLSQGAYWVYEGIVKWTKGTEVIEKTVTWKMEVVEVVERDHVTGYLLKGHPDDLAWYEEGKERGEHVIIKVGSG